MLQLPLDVAGGAPARCTRDVSLRVLGTGPLERRRRAAGAPAGGCTVRREPQSSSFKHYQFQVILKPAPDEVQQLYRESLEAAAQPAPSRHPLRGRQLGVADPRRLGHRLAGDVRWNGNLPVHLFPAGGGLQLSPISAELTYGSSVSRWPCSASTACSTSSGAGGQYATSASRGSRAVKYVFGQVDMPPASSHVSPLHVRSLLLVRASAAEDPG